MSKVQKVTAEPKMENLLASIRRAMGEEGVDLRDNPVPGRAPRKPVRPAPEAADYLDDLPEESATRGSMRESRPLPAADRREELRPATSIDISELRDKIGKQLFADLDPPKAVLPTPQPSSPGSHFRGILSGGEERGDAPGAPAPSVPRPSPAGSSSEVTTAYLRTAAHPAPPLNRAPAFGPQPTAFDIPARGATGFRPPYGNGSFGVRGYSPPDTRPEPGMMSPESGSLATGAFTKLGDTLLQRGGERSIDDLTRDLLRPMLKQWLDQNLPRLVETLVREEIERVARRGGR